AERTGVRAVGADRPEDVRSVGLRDARVGGPEGDGRRAGTEVDLDLIAVDAVRRHVDAGRRTGVVLYVDRHLHVAEVRARACAVGVAPRGGEVERDVAERQRVDWRLRDGARCGQQDGDDDSGTEHDPALSRDLTHKTSPSTKKKLARSF